MSALKHVPSGQAFYQLIKETFENLNNNSLKDLRNYPLLNPAQLSTDHGLYEALNVYFGIMIAAMSFRPGVTRDQISQVSTFSKGNSMLALKNHDYTLDNENQSRQEAYQEVKQLGKIMH